MTFDPTGASRAVLVEVVSVLGAFRDDIVVVGGWVPELLYPNRGHMGSLDVDLAISPRALGENVYKTILHRMREAQYAHHSSPTHFTKSVPGVEEPVKVDMVSGQYASGAKTRTIRVNELELNTLRGLDLAFEASVEIEISGPMPDGTHNTTRCRVLLPEAFILIKAFALDERQKQKDAYDIHFVLRNFTASIDILAGRVQSLLANGLALDGYRILKAKFAELNAVGPSWAAEVDRQQGGDYDQSRQSALQFAQALFDAVGR